MTVDKPAAAGASAGEEVGKPVVLVVDDEAANRDLLCRHLSREDVRVVTAVNGAQAIAAYCRNSPAVVLLDIRMPGVDGFEFLKWVNQEPQRAPVIVLTGSSDRNTVESAAALGASGYIVKPFNADDVRERVRSLLSNSREVRLG